MPKAVFRINYNRHAGQQEVLKGILGAKDGVIFPIICARGWGKTLFVTCDIVLPRLLARPNSQILWVAPTYKICKAPIDDVWEGIDESTGQRFIPKFSDGGFQFWDFKKSDMELHLFNNSKIHFRSADNPDSIVARGYNTIVIDEAALLDKNTFMLQILPTARRMGVQIFLITTPRGKNWIHEFYLAGQDQARNRYKSFQQPYWKRPDYPQVLVDLMKDVPEHIRRQEYFAEFVGDGGSVFRNLSAVFQGDLISFPEQNQKWEIKLTQDQLNAEPMVLAADLAKSQDYTVIVVMGMDSRKVYYYERLNKTDYNIVLEKMRLIAEAYDAEMIYDATGVGAGLQDFMGSFASAYPFKFTNESKTEIVNRLIVASEYGNLNIPNIVTVREEFELFSYELTRTGKLSYSAPDGKHDDTVMAMAMANWYAEENSGKSQIEEVTSFLDTVDSVMRPRSRIDAMLADDS